MSRVREFLARRDWVAQLAVVLGAFAAYEAATTAIALAIHWLYPTAPPRLAAVGLQAWVPG